LLTLEVWNPREFAEDKHRTVDDKPYGGGPGMLMKAQPLKDAINAAKSKAQAQCPVIYLSPQGKPLEQADLASLAMLPEVILVAGRYEGIDERLIESVIDMEVSIGDFVASGGELPAMLLIDGVTRLLPGAVGDADSVEQDSFSNGLLDYPQYTRPETEDGLTVPEVLMSGDHGQIARWRKMQSLGRTYIKRPDLITARTLTEEEKQLLDEYLAKRET
jgi:tRNA (guanine37-N1)-methyltransferase